MAEVKLLLDDNLVKKLLKKFPGETLEGAVRKAIEESLTREGSEEVKSLENEIVNIHSVVHNLQRIVTTTGDVLNSYSQLLSDIRFKLGELLSAVQGLDSKINEFLSKLGEVGVQAVPTASTVSKETYEVQKEKGKERRASAIDILRKQKVMFEADLASKIRNRDAFFEKLRRDGALVLSLTDQRVALDPGFWEEFLSKLKTLDTNSERRIQEVLGKAGSDLLKALSKNALAYFDTTKKRWVILLE